jgi:hypothetical protein
MEKIELDYPCFANTSPPFRYSGVWLITRCGALLQGGYDINDFGLCITIIMLYGVLFRFVAFVSLLKLK